MNDLINIIRKFSFTVLVYIIFSFSPLNAQIYDEIKVSGNEGFLKKLLLCSQV